MRSYYFQATEGGAGFKLYSDGKVTYRMTDMGYARVFAGRIDTVVGDTFRLIFDRIRTLDLLQKHHEFILTRCQDFSESLFYISPNLGLVEISTDEPAYPYTPVGATFRQVLKRTWGGKWRIPEGFWQGMGMTATCPYSGLVTHISKSSNGTQSVLLHHGYHMSVLTCLQTIAVNVGEIVERGEILGTYTHDSQHRIIRID